MMRMKWLFLGVLVMIGLPQRASAQSIGQKLFDINSGVIYGMEWLLDNRWLIVTVDIEKSIYYDFETHTLYQEQPQVLKPTVSVEERAYLHVTENNFAIVSISPNGRYVLYDSRDRVPIPENATADELDQFFHEGRNQIYLADRQTRQYTLWRSAASLVDAKWSPDSSGVLVWVGLVENSGIGGYITNFQDDIQQLRTVDVRDVSVQDKNYHFDWNNYYDFYAISRNGRKILAMGHDNDTEAPSLIAFDVDDPSQHRIVDKASGHIYYDEDREGSRSLVGGAGFGTDVDRYVWVLSDQGLLLHDVQNGTVRTVDSSIVAADEKLCCGNRGAFSPNGKWLAYAVYDDTNYQLAIYLVDLEQLMNWRAAKIG